MGNRSSFSYSLGTFGNARITSCVVVGFRKRLQFSKNGRINGTAERGRVREEWRQEGKGEEGGGKEGRRDGGRGKGMRGERGRERFKRVTPIEFTLIRTSKISYLHNLLNT